MSQAGPSRRSSTYQPQLIAILLKNGLRITTYTHFSREAINLLLFKCLQPVFKFYSNV